MRLVLTFFLLAPTLLIAQIRGTITDDAGSPVSNVTVSVQQGNVAAATNLDGAYELPVSKAGTYTISAYRLGYQTVTQTVEITQLPFLLNFELPQVVTHIEEIVITGGENPADRIIRQAIRHKKENAKIYDSYKVDFYSKGVVKAEALPEKIMGRKIEDDDDLLLDSSRSSILYLSETLSEVWYQRPNKFKEIVKASKISGDDQGYSFNSAMGSNFDFYRNDVALIDYVVSPLSDHAFSYYRFRLEQSFDSEGQTIFQIKIIPKRAADAVASGYIYIADDTWQIYATDMTIQGRSVNAPLIDSLHVLQQYTWKETENAWIKQTQNLDLALSIFGLKFRGKYDQVFSNYDFQDDFDRKTFGSTIIKVEKEANTFSEDFWKNRRPMVLRPEEQLDYTKRDSIRQLKNSPEYLDSLDRKSNELTPLKLLTGYTYRNRRTNFRVGYDILGNIGKFAFNAVQGYVLHASVHASKTSDTTRSRTAFNTDISYGFSDNKVRFQSSLNHRFASRTYSAITLSGGTDAVQFNASQPITPFINSVASLFFKENFIKLYQRDYIGLRYSKRVTRGLDAIAGISYDRRSPLFVNTHHSLFRTDELYPSNNPLDEQSYDTAPFDAHQIAKWSAQLYYTPGQQIIDRPDALGYITPNAAPRFSAQVTQGFGSIHGYTSAQLSVRQHLSFKSKGELNYVLRGGTFFDNDNMTFIDYKHFNGNQTHIGVPSTYLESFMILPYYAHSTNEAYLESHLEYDLKGYILNKIPIINSFNGLGMIIGHHHYSTPGRPSYQELSIGIDHIGWGKLRLLRLDYVMSFQGSDRHNGFVLGLKFINF